MTSDDDQGQAGAEYQQDDDSILEDQQNLKGGLWVEVVRWIALLPGAILAAWLAYIVVGLLHLISMDPDEWAWWKALTKEVFPNLAMGAAFVYSAVYIAPRYKGRVAIVFAGLVLILSGAALFAGLQLAHYMSIVSNIAMDAGAISVAVEKVKEHGRLEV